MKDLLEEAYADADEVLRPHIAKLEVERQVMGKIVFQRSIL